MVYILACTLKTVLFSGLLCPLAQADAATLYAHPHPPEKPPQGTDRAMAAEKIYVTQPYLPPLEEFIPYLEQIWANKVLTNGGPFHQQLEQALCRYLGCHTSACLATAPWP